MNYKEESLIIESLASNDLLISTASEGSIASSIANGIKESVLEQYDPNRPAASIAAFIGPGLLWKLGFKWMSVLYTVAEALGFDWKSFWASVGSAISQFVKALVSSKQKVSESELSDKVNSIVSESANEHFSGEVDEDKLLDVAKQQIKHKFSNDLSDMLEIKKFATRYDDSFFIKSAAPFNLFRSKLSKFFIRVIGWTVKTSLISLGLVAGSGAVSGLIGKKKDDFSTPKEEHRSYNLKVSPNASPDLFTVHPNDLSNVWIEHGNIDNINNLLLSWTLSMYPQLSKYHDEIENSSTFDSFVEKFKSRNRLASGLGLLSMPRPYQRKSEIVSVIVDGFLKEYSNKLQGSNE